MIYRATFLALLLAVLFSAVTPIQAQAPAPVTLQATVGYDGLGTHRVGHWFPALVTVSNDGPDLQAQIEWRVIGNQGTTFRYELDLPQGARKQVPLALIESNFGTTGFITVQANGQRLAEQRLSLNAVGEDEVTIGLLSSEPSLLSALETATFALNTGTRVVRMDPALLPDDPNLLSGLHVLMVHDLDSTTLRPSQVAAIEAWVRLGGELVIGGGAPSDLTTPGFAGLLPVSVGPLQSDVPTDSLAQLAGRRDLALVLPTTTANAVTLGPKAQALDDAQLLVAHQLGVGRVIFAAFDLGATRAWIGESALWSRVLEIESRMHIGASFRLRSEHLLRDTINLPGLQLPSTGLLLLLMVVYIAVIGPLNFLVLRRLRRPEWAWITTPILVVVFLATTYLFSLVSRGTDPQLIQLTVVQGEVGQPNGQATAFVGLFSPQRRSYRLDAASEALVTTNSFENFQTNQMLVTSDGSTTGVRDLLVDVASLRNLLIEQSVAVPEVQSALERDGSNLVGTIELGATTLYDVQIVQRKSAVYLGEVRPGVPTEVALMLDQGNFPQWGQLNEGGTIRRDSVLNGLFSYDRFTVGGPTFMGDGGIPDEGVYLLGWAAGPAVSLALDGNPSRQEGETLYIIRLQP